jgi:hypothetical protein
MKEVIDALAKRGLIFKSFEEIELNTRKKIRAFVGVNLKSEYVFVLVFYKKSRVLLKDIKEAEIFIPPINFRYKKKILLLNSPICSKAKEELGDWRIFWF